ncbi:hypothetical protein [Faecalicatena contorta]|uniref:hypothetical protein n=1 Tax=Faecalicatena contorta TaxID=39482 RepID=UPI001F33509E|nr:hypothetical protein [Faecalicatena contorta]MCF2554579.1 hypothetical protein [Faecalicatena contorta]
MGSSKETRISNCVCVALILLSGIARLILFDIKTMSYNGIICTFYTAAAFIWIFQLKRRLLQPEVRRNLIMVALLLVFWMVIRSLKYDFLPDMGIAARYAWYMYYIPQTFCVLLMFLSVLYIGVPYNGSISRFWKLLWIPAFLIVAGIMTNDIHQLAFYFPEGLARWNNGDYVHGPVYYVALAWMLIIFAAMLLVAFIRCAVPGRRKKIWIPLIPVGIGLFYMVLFFVASGSKFMLKVPEMISFIFAAFMESLIVAHLLPSNDRYGDFWDASSIGAGIMDLSGEIRYRSRCSIPVSPEQIREARDHEILLQDGSISLRSHEIQGGFGYWTRDISEIRLFHRELADMGDVMAEENAMLDAENKLAESRLQIEQQNELYDSLAKSVSLQLDKLSELLDAPPQDESEFEQTMKQACILNAYIKRHSNLQLLFHQNEDISGEELCFAIRESLEYVKLYDINTGVACDAERIYSGADILAAYEVFEAVLEAVIPGADAVFVCLEESAEALELHMEINAPGNPLNAEDICQHTSASADALYIETEQQTAYILYKLPAGGECI